MYIKNKVKVRGRSNIDTYVPNYLEISSMLKAIKQYDILSSYIVLKVFLDTGLRGTEVQYFLSNFFDKDIELHDNDVETIKLFYQRNTKNSYYIFMSRETLNLITLHLRALRKFNIEKLKVHIKRNKLLPLKYMRKYHFTKMIKCGVNMDMANFIQGRASQNIGFNHYLEKKELAVKEYRKLL